jgi:plastocyanin
MKLAVVALVMLGFMNNTLASDGAEVTIEAGKLQPGVLTVSLGQRVVFVNRSQWHAHVAFAGASDRHTTVRANGRTWAMVSRPGPHPYVVSLGSPDARHLHGVIQAVETEDTSSGSPTCDAMPATSICIEL